jgi:peptidoglycan hydrolase-like protein with peptidoglycan-binding domain
MGLATDTVVVRDGPRWWRGRVARLLLLAIVVAGGAVVGLMAFGGPPTGGSVAESDGGPAAAAPSEAPSVTPTRPEVVLEPGTSGPEVVRWQELLLAAGLDVSVDSQFGPATERVTARFQRSIGEEPTGRVTTRTMAAAQNGPSLRRVRIFLLRDGELDGVRRLVDRTQLARGALEMLIAGPLQVERDDGMSTAVPPGTMVRAVRVDAGTAEVTLTGFAADPDERSLRQRVEQVVATVTRFDSINAVRFQLPPDDAMVFEDAGVVLTDAREGDG